MEASTLSAACIDTFPPATRLRVGTIGQRSDDRTIGARRIEQLQSQAIPENTAESIVLLAWVEDLQNRTAWSMLAAFTHVMKERQRRYPNKAAWEVMQFRALLAA